MRVGLDIGSTTIKCVVLDEQDHIIYSTYERHQSHILEKGEEILANINANNKAIRYELGTRVRNQLRIIPELRFFIDDSLDYIERIDELLKK